MGTFGGHALPGSFFIYFSLWAIYWSLKRFYDRLAYEQHMTDKPSPPYENRVSFPLPTSSSGRFRGKQIPIDSYLKFITCLVGIIGEVITGFSDDWKFVHIGNAQHSSMFSAFGLSGIVELLMFYGLIHVPIQVEHVFVTTALLCECFLFFFHLHGRTPVDIYIHMLLAGMMVVGIVAAVIEATKPNEIKWLLIRNWSLLVQGTWFWQVGAILYPATSWMPRWDELSPTSIPRASNLFCYHLLIDYIVIVLVASAFSWRYGRMNSREAVARIDYSRRLQTVEHEDVNVSQTEEHELWNVEQASALNDLQISGEI